ncbi:MAG: pyridoxamine 5'-phosphate oxidase family protein [Planctomycetaceae bacterium]
MGKVYPSIDEKLTDFIKSQQMFFVATAPINIDGNINVSPKGLDAFRILDETTVAYADLAGSGIETVAHLRENGRIVIMFCAFNGAPNIVRLHGQGEVLERGDEGFDELRSHFPEFAGLRSLIRIRCTRISDSCGFGVPLFDHVGDRKQLVDWAERKQIKNPEEVRQYVLDRNATSIDGLPGIREAGQ